MSIDQFRIQLTKVMTYCRISWHSYDDCRYPDQKTEAIFLMAYIFDGFKQKKKPKKLQQFF